MKKTTSEARQKNMKLEAREIEIKLQNSLQQSQKDWETKAINSTKINSKYLFSFAKKFSMVKMGIEPFLYVTNNLETGPVRIKEILHEQYR